MAMHYFFSAAGDYLGGFDDGSLELVPEGAIEVDVPPAHGYDKLVNGQIVPYVEPVPLETQLNDMFKTEPKEVRAQFFTLKAAIKLALDEGDTDSAKLIIQDATVPSELESVRQQMLTLFPA